MKTLNFTILVIVILVSYIFLSLQIKELKKPELITMYTVEDTYYLKDTRVWNSSEEVDETFGTRIEAINYFENISASISQEVLNYIDTLENKIK
jgi:hypothetical protein